MVLLRALLGLAREREDVRQALATVQRWLAVRIPPGVGGEPLYDKVLTPPEKRHEARPEAAGRVQRTVDLRVVVRRARWKAEACRFAIERRAAKESGRGIEEIRAQEEVLRKKREQLEDCYAWMLDSPRPLPDDQLLRDVADCYDTVALAAEIASELQEAGLMQPSPPAELLYLLAEGQSALLAALNKCDLRGDSDQRDLFVWLKEQTTRHRIYVDRHMRLDDPADSTGSADLAERLRKLGAELSDRKRRQRARGPLLNKIRYHARKAGEAGAASEQDWQAITAAVDSWLEEGLRQDDRTLRELLGDFVERYGGDREVPEQIVTLLGTHPSDERDPQPAGRAADRPAVREQAAALLRGRKALIFGDEERSEARAPIAAALELSELEWVTLSGDSVREVLAERIRREDVELVLIAARLPQDDYAEFKRLCLEHGKPFVRLPASLEPGQVAHQILRQVGWRLRSQAAAERDR